MILAVDIGNTSITLAVVGKRHVAGRMSFDTPCSRKKIKFDCVKGLSQLKRKYPSIKKGLVCSVVPELTQIIAGIIKRELKINPLVIGKDIKVPIKNKYRFPRQVGQDRLLCAYAAKLLYGEPCIIIDFGTATTFDFVSNKGAYEGGIIVPGVQLTIESLYQKTALLPKVNEIKKPKRLIGKDTKESILSGLFYGYGVLSCGLIDLIQKNYSNGSKKDIKKINVIVTGGYTQIMKRFIGHKNYFIDKDLVLKAMAMVQETIQ